jgi:excisionase family DNA binding protein
VNHEPPQLIVLSIDTRARVILAAALALGRRQLRANGTPVPEMFDELLGALAARPQVPSSAPEWTPFDDPHPAHEPEYLSVKQAARGLNVSEKTIRRLVTSGELPAARAGRRILIPLAAIREFGGQRAG